MLYSQKPFLNKIINRPFKKYIDRVKSPSTLHFKAA